MLFFLFFNNAFVFRGFAAAISAPLVSAYILIKRQNFLPFFFFFFPSTSQFLRRREQMHFTITQGQQSEPGRGEFRNDSASALSLTRRTFTNKQVSDCNGVCGRRINSVFVPLEGQASTNRRERAAARTHTYRNRHAFIRCFKSLLSNLPKTSSLILCNVFMVNSALQFLGFSANRPHADPIMTKML